LAFTPGRDTANASNAPCLATWRSFMIVARSTPARSAASIIVVSPRSNCTQILYFFCGVKNRFRRRPARSTPRSWSVIPDPFSKDRTACQMRTDHHPDL